jgi:hypothetical protein
MLSLLTAMLASPLHKRAHKQSCRIERQQGRGERNKDRQTQGRETNTRNEDVVVEHTF